MKLADDKGAALVELAICIFVLTLLTFGITEFGRALYIKNTLTNAAREGARWAAVSPTPSLDVESIKSKINNIIPPNIQSGGTITISINPQAGLVHQETQISVEVKQTFASVVPNMFPGLDKVELKGNAAMIYE